MTVVRPNSIAGINSITVQTGQALNIHDASGNLIRNITSSSGVSTFSSLHVGSGTTTSTQGISVGTGCSIVSTTVNQLELYTNSSERLRIKSDGFIEHYGSATFQKAGSTYVRIGSTDAGGAILGLDGDSNGDGSGADYCMIKHDTDGHLKIIGDNPANAAEIQFYSNSTTERMRIDTSGRLLIGGTSSTTVWGYGQGSLQVIGDYQGGSASFINNEANTNSQAITLGKTRNGGIVSNNDTCGALVFSADDGNGYSPCSRIMGQVDGTPGDGDMPGRMVFETTADGSASLTERLRISSDGSSVFEVAATEVDIKGTGSGDRFPLRLFNSDTTSTNMTGIYFGPCNNVAGAYVAGKAEADFTSTANRDAGLEFGTRLDGNWKIPMAISAAGYVTKSLMPAFSAKNSGGGDYSGGAQVLYPNEDFDRNGDYTAGSSYFTAPIAGIYFVSWSCKSSGSSNTTCYANCQVSTNDGGSWNQRGPALEFSSDISSEHTGMAAIINLGADDRVRIASATNVRVDGSDHFAMCLLG